MKTLQDSVCWPTFHTNAQGSLKNWREKTPSRPENSSGIFRNGRLIRWRKITAVYCCCECSTRIQYPRRTTVNVVFTKARQRPVVSRRTFLETVVTGKLFLILNFLKGKTFVKKQGIGFRKERQYARTLLKGFLVSTCFIFRIWFKYNQDSLLITWKKSLLIARNMFTSVR